MKIARIDDQPFHRLRYINAARGGGRISQALPILGGEAHGLPAELDAVLITSDLQGVVPRREGTVLLGMALAEEFELLESIGSVPELARTAVILAGDLYSAPEGDKRGASGDVRAAWRAFAERFAWVAGVAGNHDRFGTEAEQQALQAIENLYLLHEEVVEVDGLRIGGVGGIIGNPDKPARRAEPDFLAALELVAGSSPDVVVLHEGPHIDGAQRGNREVSKTIEATEPPLVVCGHVHWNEPVGHVGATMVVNVDARALLLRRSG